MDADLSSEVPPELKLEYYQFSENDLDREIVLAPRPIFNVCETSSLVKCRCFHANLHSKINNKTAL